jgi:hypothetical protein
MGAKKTTFMIINGRPKGTPHAPTHLSESHHRGSHGGFGSVEKLAIFPTVPYICNAMRDGVGDATRRGGF